MLDKGQASDTADGMEVIKAIKDKWEELVAAERVVKIITTVNG